ncbi:MAG TPA: hypothetical protein GX706_03220 [Candidatus Moranbacteria bacterium]|nr:hypothetical protein [Candidatus Moranbacteria bacterium]
MSKGEEIRGSTFVLPILGLYYAITGKSGESYSILENQGLTRNNQARMILFSRSWLFFSNRQSARFFVMTLFYYRTII